HMGEELDGHEPTGGFEDVELSALCEAAYPFPTTEPALPRREIARRFRRHLEETCASAARRGAPMAGGKYPQLCALGETLRRECEEQLRVIHCDRPLAESIASLQSRSEGATGSLRSSAAEAERVQRWLWKSK